MNVPDSNVALLDTGVIYTATQKGDDCNFGEVFQTDGRIPALDLVVLEDDKEFFPVYQGAFTLKQSTLEKYPAIADVIAEISPLLTTEEMQKLNASSTSTAKTPRTSPPTGSRSRVSSDGRRRADRRELRREGAHAAHINTVLGHRDGPAGTAWATALATPSAGHVPFVAVLRPSLPVKPLTLFVTKSAPESDAHGLLIWGPAQAGVASGIADAVADGEIPADWADTHAVIAAVWVNPPPPTRSRSTATTARPPARRSATAPVRCPRPKTCSPRAPRRRIRSSTPAS